MIVKNKYKFKRSYRRIFSFCWIIYDFRPDFVRFFQLRLKSRQISPFGKLPNFAKSVGFFPNKFKIFICWMEQFPETAEGIFIFFW